MSNVVVNELEIKVKSTANGAASNFAKITAALDSLQNKINSFSGSNIVAQLRMVSTASTDAAEKVTALANAFSQMKSLKGMSISQSTISSITALSTALSSLKNVQVDTAGLTQLSSSLGSLANIPKLNINASTIKNLNELGTVAQKLSTVDFSGVSKLASSLGPLASIPKNNLGSLINQLNKLPEVAATINSMDLDKFTGDVKRLSTALEPLATQMAKVGGGATALKPALNSMGSGFTQTQAKTVTAAAAFSKVAMVLQTVAQVVRTVARIIQAAFRAIAGWVEQSMSYVETLNLFTVTMGEYAGKAQEYAEQVESIMGINIADWMNAQSVFMALGTGFGVAAEKAALMSKNLTQLGYDLSSFYNIKTADAMEKLQAGIAGELEPLRRLGFDLSMAKLQEIALANGINQRVESMTQAEKAQLRYIAIMQQSVNAQGDMARTLNAPANQLRVLQANAQAAARALGNIFIPALNAVLPAAIVALQAIRMVADAIAKMFGFSIPEVDYSGLGGAASGAADAEEALGGATKAAKEFKQATLGIDELNIISPPDNSSGGGGGGGGGGGYDYELPEYDFLADMVKSKVQEMMDKLLEFVDLVQSKVPETVFDYIRNSWERLKEAFGEFKEAWEKLFDGITAAEIIARVFAPIETAILDWAGDLMSKIAGALNISSGLMNIIDGVRDALKNLLSGAFDPQTFWEETVPQIAEGFGQLIEGGIKLLIANIGNLRLPSMLRQGIFAPTLREAMMGIDLAAALLGIDINVTGWWAGIKDKLMAVDFSTLFKGIGEAFSTWLTGEITSADLLETDLLIYNLQQQLNEVFRAVFGGEGSPFGELDDIEVGAVFQAFNDIFGPLVALAQEVGEGLREMGGAVTEVFEAIGTACGTLFEAISPLFEPLERVLKQAWIEAEPVIRPILDLLGELAAFIGDTVIVIFDEFDSWIDIVTNKIEFWGNVITIFSVGFAIAFNAVKAAFLAVANFIVQRINALNLLFDAFGTYISVTFKDGWVEGWTTIKNEFIRIIEEMVNTGIEKINSLIQTAENAVNVVIGAINQFTGLSIGEIDLGRLNLVNWTGGNVQKKADGGFVNTGELFIANEAGPELVGSIGRKTAVANNDQIISGISAGVYSAMSAALADGAGSSDGTINITVRLDSEVIYKSTEKSKRQRGYNLGMGAFAQ